MSALALHGGPPALQDLGDFPAWPQPDDAGEAALLEVYRSGKWGSTAGPVVADFEQEFAQYQDSTYGTALVNGTLAIVAALRACGVGLGDEVIVPPYTFIATASAALFIGAIPVFADVDPQTHLLDPEASAAAITERTRAIIPVHLAGRAADMDAFRELGRSRGIAVVEDCAQAIGTRFRGRAVGSLGDVGTFSFQSSKNITAGEGGLVTTSDPALAEALYSQVNVGRVRGGGWYQHQHVGYNLRLTEFQAAVLRTQLRRHPADQELREHRSQLLRAELDQAEGVQLAPSDPNLTSHGHHLFLLRLPELGRLGLRDAAVKALAAEGVAASPGYVPLHRNEAVVAEARALTSRLGQPYAQTPCPQADLVSTDTIWLPHRYLSGTEEQTRAVAAAIAKVAGAAGELDGGTPAQT